MFTQLQSRMEYLQQELTAAYAKESEGTSSSSTRLEAIPEETAPELEVEEAAMAAPVAKAPVAGTNGDGAVTTRPIRAIMQELNDMKVSI